MSSSFRALSASFPTLSLEACDMGFPFIVCLHRSLPHHSKLLRGHMQPRPTRENNHPGYQDLLSRDLYIYQEAGQIHKSVGWCCEAQRVQVAADQLNSALSVGCILTSPLCGDWGLDIPVVVWHVRDLAG